MRGARLGRYLLQSVAGAGGSDEVGALRKRLGRLENELEAAKSERKKTAKSLAVAEAELTSVRQQLAATQQELAAASGDGRAQPQTAVSAGSLASAEAIEAVRSRLSTIENSTLQAREEMMLIEVKLDIVEGAITVLDDRTRPVVAGP